MKLKNTFSADSGLPTIVKSSWMAATWTSETPTIDCSYNGCIDREKAIEASLAP
jgi:hypothetical protein